MKSIYIIFGLLFVGFSCFAQEQVKSQEDIKLYYRSSYTFGLVLHTEGLGASFKYQQHSSFKDKRFFQYELLGLNHPKQQKIFNAFDDNAKGFFYSKINALTSMRFGFGNQHAVAAKELKKGVQVAYVYSGGVNLGFLRPIYLQVYDVDGNNQIVTRRYDPEVHTLGTIYGRASFVNGLSEMSIVPGIFAKFGLNFEYSPYDEKLKSIEAGIAFDLFYKEVPIMYNTYNNQYWVTFYLMFEIGKKIE